MDQRVYASVRRPCSPAVISLQILQASAPPRAASAESKVESTDPESEKTQLKGLILAQNERWRRGLGMQVERERSLRGLSKVAKG